MTVQIISIIIVGGIVFYFLIQENKKQKKYFGEETELTAKEKKALEKYKREYVAIQPDSRLAKLEKDQWELEDIVKTATEMVYDSPIPSKTQRQNLKNGDLVKLNFIVSEEEETERLWVKVIDKKEGLFFGELDNDPFSEILKPIKSVWFHPNHVFSVDEKK